MTACMPRSRDDHNKRKYNDGGMYEVCTAVVLRNCNAAKGKRSCAGKMKWKPDREVGLEDTPIDMAIAAEGTTAEMQTDRLTNAE